VNKKNSFLVLSVLLATGMSANANAFPIGRPLPILPIRPILPIIPHPVALPIYQASSIELEPLATQKDVLYLGTTPLIDAEGNWVGSTIGLAGAAGPQGLAGAQGPQGATGPQGPAGAPGASGLVGPQGFMGPNGAPGLNGAVGAAGPAGSQGATGPQGAQGATGPAGPQGPQGVAGNNGNDGAQGLAGAMGDAGPQGPAGADGSTLLASVQAQVAALQAQIAAAPSLAQLYPVTISLHPTIQVDYPDQAWEVDPDTNPTDVTFTCQSNHVMLKGAVNAVILMPGEIYGTLDSTNSFSRPISVVGSSFSLGSATEGSKWALMKQEGGYNAGIANAFESYVNSFAPTPILNSDGTVNGLKFHMDWTPVANATNAGLYRIEYMEYTDLALSAMCQSR